MLKLGYHIERIDIERKKDQNQYQVLVVLDADDPKVKKVALFGLLREHWGGRVPPSLRLDLGPLIQVQAVLGAMMGMLGDITDTDKPMTLTIPKRRSNESTGFCLLPALRA